MKTDAQPIKALTVTIYRFSFAAGLMLSTDTLIRVGRFSGAAGGFAIAALLGTAGLFFFLHQKFAAASPTVSKPAEHFAGLFHYGVKSTAAVFLAVGLLVAAGFAFNEVFLYWFPNFAFAFLLLGLLIILQFLPEHWILRFQTGSVFTALAGLMILLTAGLIHPGPQPLPASPHMDDAPFWQAAAWWATPLLCLAGFDLGMDLSLKEKGNAPPKQMKGADAAILAFALIFTGWSVVSLQHLPQDRLMNSTIPHILAAKKVLGDPGRFLMGVIIISGTLAALNPLFFHISKGVQGTIRPSASASRQIPGKIILTACGILTATLMAAGFAGGEHVDLYGKGVLILWIISHLIRMITRGLNPAAILAAVILGPASLGLILGSSDPAGMIRFTALAGAGITIASAGLYYFLNPRKKSYKTT